MQVLRTPDARFTDLPGFPFGANYLHIRDPALGELRLHYLDEGPRGAPVALCLHGEPTWCYLYRRMIPVLTAAGFRVLAPDLVGFGRSDKPAARTAYTYASHVQWMRAWLEDLDLRDITLLAQDWGGLIGLRLATAMAERFARLALSNTALPTGDQPMPEAFMKWRAYSQQVEDFDPGLICNEFGRGSLTPGEMDAYRAPFPTARYQAGARQFPLLVPITPDDPAAPDNRQAWAALQTWTKPVLLCFSDGDPITGPAVEAFRRRVPGARGQPHATLRGGHFIQESDGENWARRVAAWAGAGPGAPAA
ncbi:MAG: alpha/beta fold hydrolase [Xanthomonadales bacterium]|nr:alpha/beta fold hydrolase [Xanthomonadales bacterium]NIN60518.1 alpha/beta fold hydrolase [Xanthomonadales bacterium]NIN75873.1 alpha/beta fold hydrolase [Xanthomonadales bacterium]NIO15263.1 alpha/beta fold hydrolase [Xanthomonadales bacterium]NIP12911.1 alpha/beta fold hydrolase [Xanthomonadales bacterium]